jgi:hypothetical protein
LDELTVMKVAQEMVPALDEQIEENKNIEKDEDAEALMGAAQSQLGHVAGVVD